jgi:hypothetical protein
MQCYDVRTCTPVHVKELTNKVHYMEIEKGWEVPILSGTEVYIVFEYVW